MPQFYRVLKADPLGDPWTNPNVVGAKPVQKFWCQVEGVDEPVMMGKQVPNTPSLTEGHYGVLEQATSTKGNPYWKFTSMQIPQGTSKPQYAASAPAQEVGTAVTPAMYHALEERVSNLEKILATPLPVEAVHEEERKTLGKEELEDIFGGEITIQDIPDKEEPNEEKET